MTNRPKRNEFKQTNKTNNTTPSKKPTSKFKPTITKLAQDKVNSQSQRQSHDANQPKKPKLSKNSRLNLAKNSKQIIKNLTRNLL